GPLCVAGILHQGVGLRRGVLVLLEPLLVLGREPRRDERVGIPGHELRRLARLAVRDLAALSAVDRMSDGLAEPLVLELRRLLPMEVQRRTGEQRTANDLEALILELLVG